MDRSYRKTIFCDIDGTIVYHQPTLYEIITSKIQILDNVIQKFSEWREKDRSAGGTAQRQWPATRAHRCHGQ